MPASFTALACAIWPPLTRQIRPAQSLHSSRCRDPLVFKKKVRRSQKPPVAAAFLTSLPAKVAQGRHRRKGASREHFDKNFPSGPCATVVHPVLGRTIAALGGLCLAVQLRRDGWAIFHRDLFAFAAIIRLDPLCCGALPACSVCPLDRNRRGTKPRTATGRHILISALSRP